MSDPNHFYIGGQDFEREPYQYRECGLDNIFLLDGFHYEEYDGDRYIYIDDVDGLWKAIGIHLVVRQKTLSPREIKFLRMHMELTQAELARKLRVDDQTVARWEKGRVRLPGPADLALRASFLASPAAHPEGLEILKGWHDLVAQIVDQDQSDEVKILFGLDNHAWAEKAPECAYG